MTPESLIEANGMKERLDLLEQHIGLAGGPLWSQQLVRDNALEEIRIIVRRDLQKQYDELKAIFEAI